MNGLWQSVMDNVGFVLVCIVLVAALAVGAKLVEKHMPKLTKVSVARRVSIIGICSALAAVLHMMDFPLLFLAPEFYKLDFSELPVILAGFYLGPSATVTCEGIKILLKLLLKGTSTAFVGDLANFVVGCSFVLPTTIWYTLHKTRAGAVAGLVLGTVSMTILGTAFNAVYLLPKFAQLYGIPLEVIIGMGTAIHGNVQGVVSFVVMCVAPLNLVKGTVISILSVLLYKRVARPLFQLQK